MKHILIYGKRNSGKTLLFDRLLNKINVPVYGFVTCITSKDPEGFHQIHMFSVSDKERKPSDENLIGVCNMKNRTIKLETFNNLGVKLLKAAKPDGVIVMDELGFMEEKAYEFCDQVFKCLDGDIPVIATVRRGEPFTDFLQKVIAHPNAEVYKLEEDNLEELWEELLPAVKSLTETR